MGVPVNKKQEAEKRARVVYDRLMNLPRDPSLSNNDWCRNAGVSTSFFSNLKGRDNKPASEPTLGNLRLILEYVGSSLPEFFVAESKGRLAVAPSRQELIRAISEALPGLPRAADRRAQYLADTVASALGLPAGLRDAPGNDESEAEDAREASVPAQ